MKPVVVARRLSVGYGSRVVLEDVDTYLEPGGSVALVGSNGSGKSTLLKTFAGLLPALDGGLEILGAPPGGHCCLRPKSPLAHWNGDVPSSR